MVQRLSAYGEFIATYSGAGTLALKNAQTISCTFEAGQLRNGEIRLLCTTSDFYSPDSPIERFNGETVEGYRITAEGYHASSAKNMMFISAQISSQSGMWVAYRLDKMTVQLAENIHIHSAHFGLTNFLLKKPFTLQLASENEEVQLSIQPLKGNRDVMYGVPQLRSIDVTCEVVGIISIERDKEWLESIVADLCYLLSVAHGTTIQWIYCDLYDENEICLWRNHSARITKSYSPLSVFKGDEETKTFVERTYRTYKAKREDYKLDHGTIEAYLAAKHEYDPLELRGVKLAVAMEMLKAVLLKLPNVQIREYILDDDDFKSIKHKLEQFLRSELKKMNIGQTQRKAIYEKLSELNRWPFEDVLTDFFIGIGLHVEERDLQRFIKSRNSLVHEGRFYYETAKSDDQKKEDAFNSITEEYYFLVNFLDKVFLKLLGYSGLYRDCSSSNNDLRSELA